MFFFNEYPASAICRREPKMVVSRGTHHNLFFFINSLKLYKFRHQLKHGEKCCLPVVFKILRTIISKIWGSDIIFYCIFTVSALFVCIWMHTDFKFDRKTKILFKVRRNRFRISGFRY